MKLKTETFVTSDGETVEFTRGSGNVFADLGLPDAEILQFKSGLICEIQRIIKARGLTQGEAAEISGMDQPTLSKLLRGQFFKVSTDRLFEMLNRLGCDVEVRVTPRKSKEPGETRALLIA